MDVLHKGDSLGLCSHAAKVSCSLRRHGKRAFDVFLLLTSLSPCMACPFFVEKFTEDSWEEKSEFCCNDCIYLQNHPTEKKKNQPWSSWLTSGATRAGLTRQTERWSSSCEISVLVSPSFQTSYKASKNTLIPLAQKIEMKASHDLLKITKLLCKHVETWTPFTAILLVLFLEQADFLGQFSVVWYIWGEELDQAFLPIWWPGRYCSLSWSRFPNS